MKKLFSIACMLMLTVGLTACEETQEEKQMDELSNKVIEKIEENLAMNNDELAE